MYFIGIDLGTSAVKLLLMDENGSIEKIVSKEYPIYYPKKGWSEQNPEDWYLQTKNGLKELISEVDKKEITGLGIGGQMHG
ncbi:MAG: xylulokinase, partial [Clostridiales bacterium]|nr:xylulokinase [Clostridiales bacterium]